MAEKKYLFKKLDAFATEKSEGNPADSIWLHSVEDITPPEMQAIAKQLWKKDTIIIEQNRFIDNYNIVKLQSTKDEEGNERVIFGGSAVKRIEGEYFLY